MVQAGLPAIGDNMVYRGRNRISGQQTGGAGTASRAISQTKPSISNEEQEMEAKRRAAAAAMGQSSVQKVPAPMPTGAAAPPPNVMKDGLVNTRPRATPKQGLDFGAARQAGGPGFTGGLAGGPGAGLGVTPGQTPGFQGAGAGRILDAVNAPDYNKGRAGIDFPAESSEYRDPIMPDERNFRDRLEEVLLGKLDETPEARAQREAGRALAAARAQAGRGQMGMSGGMLAMQSDVVTKAVSDAEDRLFQQQLGAGKIGSQLEAMDKAEKLGLLDYMQSADFENQAEAKQFLEDYLGMDAGTGTAMYNLFGGSESGDQATNPDTRRTNQSLSPKAQAERRSEQVSEGLAEQYGDNTLGTEGYDADKYADNTYMYEGQMVVDGRKIALPNGARSTGNTKRFNGSTHTEYEYFDVNGNRMVTVWVREG